MKTTYISLVLALLFTCTLSAQSLGEYKPGLSKYGLKEFKKGSKKVYISNFSIHFEVYKDAVDYKAAGGFRNTKRGEATARAAVGLLKIESADIQAQADKLYQEFVADLTAAGYEIITPEAAAATEAYQGWERADGPYIQESGLPGVLVAVPDGYSFFYKRQTKKGKKKKGFLGGLGKPAALSKQLDDATIAEVDLYVMFTEDKQSLFKGNAAKVKILTNLRVVGSYAITSEKKGGMIKFKGATTVDQISSKVNFFKGKVGLGTKGAYQVSLKKPLEIAGIIPQEKITAYQKGATTYLTSFNTSSYNGLTFYSLEDRFSETAKWIDVDSKKYAQGLYDACSKILKNSSSDFIAASK